MLALAPRHRRPLLVGVVLLVGPALLAGPALPLPLVPLECRLDAGAWGRCTMEVVRLGEHWWIRAGDQRIEFRHDGKGRITMRRAVGSSWQVVTASWSADAALCWDGVCARGAIPLD